MPHYRLHIKLEGQNVREFIIEDFRKDIEFVYMDYKKRVNAKNGTGRVIYFDLVMIAECSLTTLEERKEVFNPVNNFGLFPVDEKEFVRTEKWRNYKEGPPLSERMKR
jgi:hypothetical protein